MTRKISARRLFYFLLALLTIACGLASRHFGLPKLVGDALYATLIFWLSRFIVPNFSLSRAVLFSLLFSFAVEFSQSFHTPKLDAFRATTLGHLVLGSDFAWADLGAYVIGVGAGMLTEKWLTARGLFDRMARKENKKQEKRRKI